MARAPWSDCKVAFPILNPDRFTAALDRRAFTLPDGWEHCETDGAGARWVVVFRVEAFPLAEDGRAVARMIRRYGR